MKAFGEPQWSWGAETWPSFIPLLTCCRLCVIIAFPPPQKNVSLGHSLCQAKPQELGRGENSFVPRKWLVFVRVYWKGKCVEGREGRKMSMRGWLGRRKSYFGWFFFIFFLFSISNSFVTWKEKVGKEFCDTSGILPGELWLFLRGVGVGCCGWGCLGGLHQPGRGCRRFSCGWMDRNWSEHRATTSFLNVVKSCGVENLGKVHAMLASGWAVWRGELLAGGEPALGRLALQVWKVPCSVSQCCNI